MFPGKHKCHRHSSLRPAGSRSRVNLDLWHHGQKWSETVPLFVNCQIDCELWKISTDLVFEPMPAMNPPVWRVLADETHWATVNLEWFLKLLGLEIEPTEEEQNIHSPNPNSIPVRKNLCRDSIPSVGTILYNYVWKNSTNKKREILHKRKSQRLLCRCYNFYTRTDHS